MDFLTNLRLRRQLQLMALAFVVPAVIALGMILQAEIRAVRTANRELDGAAYIQTVVQADIALNRYYVDPSLPGPDVLKAVAATVQAQTALAGKLSIVEEHTALEKAWADFVAAPDQASADAAMAAIDAVIRKAGDASGLILDPDLPSYYLMEQFVVDLPSLVDGVGDLGRRFRHAGEVGELLYEDQLDLRRIAAIAANDVDKVHAAVETIVQETGLSEVSEAMAGADEAVAGPVNALLTLNNQMTQLPDVAMMMAMNRDPTKIRIRKKNAETYQATTLAALDSIESAFSMAFVNFGRELDARNAGSYQRIATSVSIGFLLFAVTTVVVLRYASRYLSRPLTDLRDQIERLARDGDDVVLPETRRRDEIGDILRATVTLKEAVQKAFTLQDMVQRMPLNIMTCDPASGTVTYVNETSRRMLHQVEAALPCKADEVEGNCIDIFHDSPHGPRALIADDSRLPFSTEIRLGAECMRLTISPLYDKSGAYTSAMLAWEHITRQKQMADLFAVNMDGVIGDAGLVKGTAEQLQQIARRTGDGMRTADGAVGEITGLIDELANTSEELSLSITEISQRLMEANQQTLSGVDLANDSIAAVDGLARVAEEIGSVVGLITDIANQTNLLSLNATIEAARAGEAGKGFAVVANEVKTLAAETARATETIRQRVDGLRQVSQSVVSSIGAVTESISTVNGIVATLSAAVEEQTAATSEIAGKIHQTATRASTASQDLRTVASSAEETESEANALLEVSSKLQSRSETLGQEWSRFMSS